MNCDVAPESGIENATMLLFTTHIKTRWSEDPGLSESIDTLCMFGNLVELFFLFF